ncbi:PREDICTED: uncharacterized protein LOC109210142 [Nicotiana attenuata]|uniref:uncharacterized protein LOC109210142 n=1 Tax=Nicotiana attenuata TaxID=49451 RepID=UPI000905A629|nr:PREDICTED: uncharacterized protein LOC109210142 [Nicotiana attenuata]
MVEYSELWDVICDGPFVPTKNLGDPPISACQLAKEIWEALQTAHEGTIQVKQSKIDMLTTEYELFRMKDDESVQEIHTRFTSIINELHSLDETIPRNKLVRKILSVLPSSWESKVNAITEAKDLQELTIDKLVGNLKTYEMKKKRDSERREPKREKNLILKTESNDSSGEDGDMAYLTRRFQRMDQYKNNSDKAAKRNSVPDRRFNRKNTADNVVRQALAAWGDSSRESGEDDEPGSSSMMAVESEATEYDSIFALMAQPDDEDDDDDESRDDLVVVAVDLRETIENLKKEKDGLGEKVFSIEHKRDDLLVVVMDLKKTIGELEMESSHKPVTGEVVLVAKRYKNIYVADFESLKNGDLSCLSVVDDDAELWIKDETFEVFVAFVKKIQVKMGNKVACIRSDHGTEFDNVKFDEFCTENGITHKFSTPRTPQ